MRVKSRESKLPLHIQSNLNSICEYKHSRRRQRRQQQHQAKYWTRRPFLRSSSWLGSKPRRQNYAERIYIKLERSKTSREQQQHQQWRLRRQQRAESIPSSGAARAVVALSPARLSRTIQSRADRAGVKTVHVARRRVVVDRSAPAGRCELTKVLVA